MDFFLIFIILSFIYLGIILGLVYLSYNYILYINKLEKEKCGCSKDIKRDMIKNFSYIILGSWALLFIGVLVCPPKKIYLLNNKYISLINFLMVMGYGFLLFFYSRKLIEESCKCSESWVRDAMQYQSYVYISLSVISVLTFLIKILIGNDKKEYFKLLKALRN